MAKKRNTDSEAKLLNLVMPDGKKIRDCSPAEIDVMRRWFNEEATIGDLHTAGPTTADLALQIACDIGREQFRLQRSRQYQGLTQ